MSTPTGGAATEPTRLHPLSPVIFGLRAAPVALVAILASGGAQGVVGGGWQGALAGVGVALGLGLLVVLYQWFAWQRFGYYFDDAGDLRVDSGVLTRTQRRLQLSRLQSADIVQPLVARALGLAELRVEVAGAGDSRARLQYLARAQAEQLRAEILARAAGVRVDAGAAPEQVLVRVSPRDLALSLAMSSAAVAGVLVTGVVVGATLLTGGVAGLFSLVVTGGLPLLAVVNQFQRYYDFTVAESPDGLRLRSGLLSLQSQTVPPGRVHAVEYEQPLLWRSQDWVRVNLTLAGLPAGSSDQDGVGSGHVLLPVATTRVGAQVLDRVLPGLRPQDLDWQSAPRQSRWRAPVQWRRLAVAADDTVVATRRGRLVRRLAVAPHARVQSVRLVQGPWQRRLGLASLHVDTVPGPVSVVGRHLAAGTASAFLRDEVERAARARRTAAPLRWMSEPPAHMPVPDAGLAGLAPPPHAPPPAAGPE